MNRFVQLYKGLFWKSALTLTKINLHITTLTSHPGAIYFFLGIIVGWRHFACSMDVNVDAWLHPIVFRLPRSLCCCLDGKSQVFIVPTVWWLFTLAHRFCGFNLFSLAFSISSAARCTNNGYRNLNLHSSLIRLPFTEIPSGGFKLVCWPFIQAPKTTFQNWSSWEFTNSLTYLPLRNPGLQ